MHSVVHAKKLAMQPGHFSSDVFVNDNYNEN